MDSGTSLSASIQRAKPDVAHPIVAQNWFDRAVEAVSPQWAAGRYAARAQIQMARGVPEASFRGAVHTRSSVPWGIDQTFRGGRAEDRRDLGSMRDRARRIYDDNVIGGGLLDAETDNVVSDGFSLQMLTSDAAFNAEAEERFYKWLDKADVEGLSTGADLFRDSWREPRKDGDGGYILQRRGGYPYLQYIPGDLIQNPWGLSNKDRGKFDFKNTYDGVECDLAGKPIRFWVADKDETGKNTFTPIDARDFVYLAPKRKKMSVRGSTVYRRIFRELDQLDAYPDAVTKAAIMSAIFGLVEKRRNPAAVLGQLGTTTSSEGTQQKAVTYENGMVKVIGTDESVVTVQATQPMQQAPEWVRTMVRLACLAFDMPIEIGMRDLSQVNFSGGRIGLNGFYRSCRVKMDWLKSRCWNRIVFWWLSIEKQRQDLGFDDAFKAKFPAEYGRFELHGREWDLNDPLADAQSDLLEISMGIQSTQGACEKRGRDYMKLRRDRITQITADRTGGVPVVLSNVTRDERQQVTAVDANGNPVDGSAAQPPNGAQITAAVDVLTKYREGALSDLGATELLAGVGVPPDKAKAIVGSLGKLTTGTGDVAFKREVVKALLVMPAAREAVYNATDIEDLISQTGLTPEKDYETPFIPIIAPPGPLVSGALIYGPDGDLVGGDVENAVPFDDRSRNPADDQQDDPQGASPSEEGATASEAVPNE